MSPLLAQNTSTDAGVMSSIRDNAVYRAINTVRQSAPLTITFWGLVITAIAFVLRDGVWAGILGVWGIALTAFGICWYWLAIKYVQPSKPDDVTSDANRRFDWNRVSVIGLLPAVIGVYAGYVTSGSGAELVAAPLAFIAAAAYLYTKPTTLEALGHGLYALGLTTFLTPFVFYFGVIPQSAQNAGIRIDHMLAFGSILFMFSLLAFLIVLAGYFINDRAQKKSDQQRLKARMGLE